MQSYKKIIRKLIRESINLLLEVGDGFSFAGEDFDYHNREAIPFFYYWDELYVGNGPKVHRDMIWDYKSLMGNVEDLKKDAIRELGFDVENAPMDVQIEAEVDAVNTLMFETHFNGRVWTKRKVIAFWRLPDSEEKFLEIINDLNSKIKGLNIDGSWRIFTQDENGDDNMIPLKDYTHGKLSPEAEKINNEKYKQHMMSPLEKEKQGLRTVPQGWGSTHPDYAGHRAIDRALGRAQE